MRRATIAGFTLTEGVHASGTSLPWHTHDGPTLCLVLEGAFIEESAAGALLCTPSTLKIMPAGERHRDTFDRGPAHGLLIEAEASRADAIRPYSSLLQQSCPSRADRWPRWENGSIGSSCRWIPPRHSLSKA